MTVSQISMQCQLTTNSMAAEESCMVVIRSLKYTAVVAGGHDSILRTQLVYG